MGEELALLGALADEPVLRAGPGRHRHGLQLGVVPNLAERQEHALPETFPFLSRTDLGPHSDPDFLNTSSLARQSVALGGSAGWLLVLKTN